MRRRFITLLVAAIAVLATAATPALAISHITNTFTASDLSVSTSQRVNFSARTVYSWEYVPNPYTSNFLTEVNYRHFNRPVTTSQSGVGDTWTYQATGKYTTPSWQVYVRSFPVLTTQTRAIGFYAYAKSSPSGDRRKHYHGQLANVMDSTGVPAVLYTTHN